MHCLLTQSHSTLLAQWALLAVWNSVWPYLVMLLGFSVIVFVHELGHFAVAKWVGVRVEKFAIGFGRELFGFTRGETRYSFNLLPLGGYVKMLGQEDFDDKTNELIFKDDPRSFINKPVGHRVAIVSAGVIMNTLFACLLFMIVFLIGMDVVGTRIAYVERDSPAERAGLLPGDNIKKINGENILEFNEVRMAILLAPPHEPIEFIVERDGEYKSLRIQPEYKVPQSAREMKRQIVGIRPGVTRKIIVVGPEMDPSRPDHPHVGDVIAEINGIEVTDENVNEVINTLVYAEGDVYVEREDPNDPSAPPQRVKVTIPPILGIYPSDTGGEGVVNILGLAPLARFDSVSPKGRAYLAGLEPGDTVLNWDDIVYPSHAALARTVYDCAERDIYFEVRKLNGPILEGFVRPKRNRRGSATIQAICKSIEDTTTSSGEPRAWFSDVRPRGRAARAGIEAGDVILSCTSITNPTMADVNRAVRTNAGGEVPITVRKADGRIVETTVVPQAPGSIEARCNLVADDLLRVGGIVDTIHGRPSPAALAGVEPGSLITAVNGRPVARWRELIDEFRDHAGDTIDLAYLDANDQPRVAAFPVPHCLRSLLGVGPEARILSIDGQETVTIETTRGPEKVSVTYRKGTRAILTELVGRTRVHVEYRKDPLADVQSAYVDVTSDMVDPWLGRIAFSANIDVFPESKRLQGENALQAVWIGLHKTYYFILQVYKILERMIFTRSVGLESVSGPLGIIDMGGRFARSGFVDFIFFMAIISANLAVINFLPLPIVDGGLMIFLIIEKIKGSPVSIRVQVATQMIGLVLIIGVFLYVTFNDAMRLWG